MKKLFILSPVNALVWCHIIFIGKMYWSLIHFSLPTCDRTSRSFYLVVQQMADTRAYSASLSKVNSLNVPNLVPEPPPFTLPAPAPTVEGKLPGLDGP